MLVTKWVLLALSQRCVYKYINEFLLSIVVCVRMKHKLSDDENSPLFACDSQVMSKDGDLLLDG